MDRGGTWGRAHARPWIRLLPGAPTGPDEPDGSGCLGCRTQHSSAYDWRSGTGPIGARFDRVGGDE
jgi:hypothetical protein